MRAAAEGSSGTVVDGVKVFTGLPNCALFLALLPYILGIYEPKFWKTLPHAQQLLMVLVRLHQDLARRFRISCSSVSLICSSWVGFLSTELRPCIFWPNMDDIW